MFLAPIPLDCDSRVISDWFELYVLLNSEYYVASFSDIQRMWDLRRNSEESSPDESGSDREHDGDEKFVQDILAEIQERMRILGSSYPFQFNKTNTGLELKRDTRVGHVIYLFCLLISNAEKPEIFKKRRKFPYELDNEVRDFFQACSTWAAAAALTGSASAFGFPRPDGSNFLDKLREVYAAFGEGKVRKKPMKGVSSSPKDEGIDIIAWRHRADSAPGKLYVIGQVATGANWLNKSVVEYIEPFHKSWFSIIPSSSSSPAMFIPFCIPLVGDATLTEQLHILTQRYGQVYYRYLIPSLADEGYILAHKNRKLKIDRTEDLEHIADWVFNIIGSMKPNASA